MDFKSTLKLTTVMAAAILAAGCDSSDKFNPNDGWSAAENTAVCTDAKGQRVDDTSCRRPRTAGMPAYMWYYMGRGSYVPPYGGRVGGGSFSRGSGSYATSESSAATISRGGFGSSAHFAAVGE